MEMADTDKEIIESYKELQRLFSEFGENLRRAVAPLRNSNSPIDIFTLEYSMSIADVIIKMTPKLGTRLHQLLNK